MKSLIHRSLLVLVQPGGTCTGIRLLSGSQSWRSGQLRQLCLANGQVFNEPREIDTTGDQRARLSRLWVPTGGMTESKDEDSHSKLIRAGFLRQAHSGIFHMLPLGRRVQDKLEALIDKHMSKLAASKLALSSISSQELWIRSGRLDNSSEIFRFKDRKDVGYLLAPTHEEEITSLVGSTVKSYRELPVRLYQISRKYRDELRPRHGLLRSREFIMKDLYTFDYSTPRALATYDDVRKVYAELFDELKLPYLVARADSGDMGGNLSHEFHFPTTRGEDFIISCSKSCGYVVNEELAESPIDEVLETGRGLQVWRGISRDRQTLINVWHPCLTTGKAVNLHAVNAIIPEVDPSIEKPSSFWLDTSTPSDSRRLVNLVDGRLPNSVRVKIESSDPEIPFWPNAERPPGIIMETISQSQLTQQPLNLLRIMDGDACPECDHGVLKVQKAIELGHTFHLGTRYSDPLKATVTVPMDVLEDGNPSTDDLTTPVSTSTQEIPMQMGCHGIGVSRIIGAVADTLADEKGLNWPRVIAPYEIVIVPGKGLDEDALKVYDTISHISHTRRDVILDDRAQTFPWKMRDADSVGYPIIVVLGRKWNSEGACEVQCRRLKVREDVPLNKVPAFVDKLLAQL